MAEPAKTHPKAADFQKNDPKTIRSWALFDWANSSYALVIVVAIFPAYFLAMTPERLTFLGVETTNSALLAYAVSVAYAIVMILMPALAGIADYGGRKKFFMRIFTIAGSAACAWMFFFTKDWVHTGFWTYVVATVGFAGGMVFYNAFLPEIVTEDRLDMASARGFIMGYIGSVLLLVGNLACITYWDKLGFADEGQAVRSAFLTVGIWWFVFSQISLWGLPNDRPSSEKLSVLAQKGWAELVGAFHRARASRSILGFLGSFFFYNAGVQTVIFLATAFAKTELNFETSQLILTVLILQFVGIAGAWLFSKLSQKKGNFFAIVAMLVIWAAICAAASTVTTEIQFYATAFFVGLVMGGIQSLSRSTFAKLLPENTTETASFFSFYDVVEKGSVIFGTAAFGLIDQITGSMRGSVLALGVFFLIGLGILVFFRPLRGTSAA